MLTEPSLMPDEPISHQNEAGASTKDLNEAERLLQEYLERVVKASARRNSVTDPHTIDDAQSEVYLRAHNSIKRNGLPKKFAPWLSRVADSQFLDNYRKQARRPQIVEPSIDEEGEEDEGVERMADLGPTVEEQYGQTEIAQKVYDVLDQLQPLHKEVLINVMKGLTDREIAKAMNIKYNAFLELKEQAQAEFRHQSPDFLDQE